MSTERERGEGSDSLQGLSSYSTVLVSFRAQSGAGGKPRRAGT